MNPSLLLRLGLFLNYDEYFGGVRTVQLSYFYSYLNWQIFTESSLKGHESRLGS